MKRIIKGIIPAAGLGTRMFPLSKKIPKEMFSIGTRPIIEYTIDDMINSGIKEIAIITHPEKKIMKDYILEVIKKGFGNKPSAPDFYFINQIKRLGLAHAIYLARDFVDQKPFAVFLPDNLVQTNIRKENIYQSLIDLLYEKNVNTVAVEKIHNEAYANIFGNCGKIRFTFMNSSVLRIDEIMDKMHGQLSLNGKPFIYKTVARSFFMPEIFSYIEDFLQRGDVKEYDDVPILQKLAKQGKLYGLLCDWTVYDVGNPKGYLAAQRHFKKFS